MIEMKTNVEAGETPAEITISMIDQDLKDGVSKSEMAIKYSIKPWEVDEMFKHPFLKGRRPSRKKALSFKFVDDTDTADATMSRVEEQDWIDAAAKEEVDPNQVTLEDAIDEAIESVKGVKDQMQETQEAIVEMLSPMDPTETVESLIDDITGIPNGDTMSDTDDEDLEIDEDTFEL